MGSRYEVDAIYGLDSFNGLNIITGLSSRMCKRRYNLVERVFGGRGICRDHFLSNCQMTRLCLPNPQILRM